MYNKNLEELMPIIAKIIDSKIKAYNNADDKEKKKLCKVVKEFNGYFASFGPSVIMAGLRQTVVFYEDKYSCVNDIIWEAISQMNWTDGENDLTALVNDTKNLQVKQRVLDIVISCKLTIRTFDLKD
jgi:CRISPR/Cas system CMR-associated protein Cmr5 small subunit